MHKIKIRMTGAGVRGLAALALAGVLALSGAVGVEVKEARAQEEVSRSEMPMAPDASATDLRGKNWSLRSLRGYPVIVTMFATWCPPSREQLAELDKLQQKYGRDGLFILAVSEEDPETLSTYARRHDLKVPLLNDSGQMMAAFGATSYPSTFFIGSDGRVLLGVRGGSSELTPILAELAQHELAPVRLRTARAQESARESARFSNRSRRLATRGATRGANGRVAARRVATSSAIRSRSNANSKPKRMGATRKQVGDGVLLLSNSGAHVLR